MPKPLVALCAMILAIIGVPALAVTPEGAEDAGEACEQLSYSYAAAVDGNDPAGLAELFTQDGRWQLSADPMVGQAAIRDYLVRFISRKTAVSLHITTNIRITQIAADQAIGTAYVQIYSIAKGETPGFPRGIGIYRDRFVKTAKGWRFAERILERVTS